MAGGDTPTWRARAQGGHRASGDPRPPRAPSERSASGNTLLSTRLGSSKSGRIVPFRGGPCGAGQILRGGGRRLQTAHMVPGRAETPGQRQAFYPRDRGGHSAPMRSQHPGAGGRTAPRTSQASEQRRPDRQHRTRGPRRGDRGHRQPRGGASRSPARQARTDAGTVPGQTARRTRPGQGRGGDRARRRARRRGDAGGAGPPSDETARPRRRPGPADARAHLGPLTPGSGGSWRAAPCPRSASVSRGARRAAGSGGGNALGRTRGRTEDRTTTAPPPGAREGRGEPGGEGEPPSGREATERGDGPEAEAAARPARRRLPSLRGTGFLSPTHRQTSLPAREARSTGSASLTSARRHQGPGRPRSSRPLSPLPSPSPRPAWRGAHVGPARRTRLRVPHSRQRSDK